ncbi:mechanosensitive ion channel family protein [Aurantiacibacter sediminis]|uniref:Small-conductance mechanosensitive channel n=1 Tax=Aurantiacibacter sediminis TaxID=2793064 RepID=A0ABS0N102_9SPHN|nr:mechanosensitive ion channel family protein [Aurantiacibacter sediminis]MBH5321603.1 mechanosensitive ion channel family protein [Aurantiacibacter sediminis]
MGVLLALAAPVMAAVPAADAPAEEVDAAAAPEPRSMETEQTEGEDERITARLSEIFANVPSLSDVTPTVSEGVVTLSGTAPDDAAIARAEAIALGFDSVVTVENSIERDVSVDLGEGIGGIEDRVADIWRMLPLAGLALAVAIAIALLGYLLASFRPLWNRITPNAFLAELIVSAIRFVFVVLGIVIALDMIGAGALMGAVLGGAGVIGIALGFAMRDTVENYVASLMLSLRQPFRANDHIVIDGTHEGRVIRLTSRATVILTLDGNHLRIPNSTVFKGTILNYTRNPQRRFDFALGVDADDDAEAARQLGRDTLAGMPFVLDDPAPEVRISEVGDSNVVLQFFGWIDQGKADFFKAKSRAIAIAKVALEEAGFALPEPIYRLRFDQRTATLPFQNVGERGDRPKPAPAPSPTPSPTPKHTDINADVAPEDEVARMVKEERDHAGGDHADDLLDSSRPVE